MSEFCPKKLQQGHISRNKTEIDDFILGTFHNLNTKVFFGIIKVSIEYLEQEQIFLKLQSLRLTVECFLVPSPKCKFI